MPQAFVHRETELGRLERWWITPGAQLITLWGRRRVGKSTLLARFAAGRRAVYLYGTRTIEADVLTGFALEVADALGDDYLRSAPFPSWDAALDYLARQAETQRLLVVLDEFSYLCDVSPGLDTLVQRWWDRAGHRANLMLVLAGSGFSFMTGLTGARGALHGRRTGQLTVEPFDYRDARSFYPGLDPVDAIRMFACVGGVPAYLRHVDQAGTLSQNLLDTALMPGHFLFHEAEELLRTEFHNETLYGSILRAIARGQERPSDIARAVGKHSANEVFDHLQRLRDLGFVRREVPVTETSHARGQRVLYRLSDPYLRFWFRYVAPHQALLQHGKREEVWRRDILPTLDEFVARTAWEEVCAQALWRMRAAVTAGAHGAASLTFAELGRWWDSEDEIDLVGLRDGRAVLVGECKWSAAPIAERVFAALQHKAGKLPLSDRPSWVLAGRSGFAPALERRAERSKGKSTSTEEGDGLLLLTPTRLYGDLAT